MGGHGDDHGGGHDEVHPEELQFDADVREKRRHAAQMLQGVVRIRLAGQKIIKKRNAKRAMLPAQDEHGHANPATIRYWTPIPMVHVHHHEESFFELFYDLIIVVVLMNLSYLKYEMSWFGLFTVIAIFSNFWSVWSLLNVYVTMLHQEDAVHRVYYALHVVMSFVMCVATTHPKFPFFDFRYQGFFLAVASIIVRFWTVAMWLLFLRVDSAMRANPDYAPFLPKYERAHVKAQVWKHAGSIGAAMVIFAITAPMVYDGDPKDGNDRRVLASSYSSSYSSSSSYASYSAYSAYGCRRLEGSYSAYGGGCDDTYAAEADQDQYAPVIALWLLAVAVEQCGNVHAAIFDQLPFSGEYCGDRMQAWLMLCFGESLIGLLINPLYYDAVSIKSVLAAFVMVFCLVTGYFDVTDADKFLHLFILRKEKWYAFAYCIGQCFFSLFVFMVGVALKSIMYVNYSMHDIEVSAGCDHGDEALRRRLWAAGGELDRLAHGLGDQYGKHFNLLGALGDQPAGEWASGGGGSAGSDGHRRLASWTLDQYDDLLHKCFLLLSLMAVAVQASSIGVAYCMPTDQDMQKVRVSRLGALVATFCGLVVPFNLKSIKTQCLGEYEDAHRRRLFGSSGLFLEGEGGGQPLDADARALASYSASYSSYSASSASSSDYSAAENGLSVTEALIVSALIVAASFAIHCFSMDVEREHTYKELEEAAHHGREPVLHTLAASTKKSLADRGGVAFVASGFGAKVAPAAAAPAGH